MGAAVLAMSHVRTISDGALDAAGARGGSRGRTDRGGGETGFSSVFLIVEDVAAHLRCSVRTVHELTRGGKIPHRKLPGCRRCLFRADEIDAWENGAQLEVIEMPRGGRIVRPSSATQAASPP